MRIFTRPLIRLICLVVFPARWMRLLALLAAVSGVTLLFYLGAKPFAGGLFSHPIDKMVHLVTFGGLAAVLWIMLGGRGRLADHGAVILAGLVGTADESIQRLLPTREASLGDLLFDMIGIFVAVACMVGLRAMLLRSERRHRRRNRRKSGLKSGHGQPSSQGARPSPNF